MVKRRKHTRSRQGLQAVTLCISTAMVLILLGIVVFSGLVAHNLSAYVRQNIVVSLVLQDDMTDGEAKLFCDKLRHKPYTHTLQYISKEQALSDGIKELGVDPREFVDANPFLSSVEITLLNSYANNDSLALISKELKAFPKVSDVKYQKDLIESVNANIAKISIVLIVIALLLTIVSFSLINNTVRLGIYAHRFSIHTMKLVGASWGFIRRPFVAHSFMLGMIASTIACCMLGIGVYMLMMYEPDIVEIVTWEVLAFTAATVYVFGATITSVCTYISVSKFLRMKAGRLYKI